MPADHQSYDRVSHDYFARRGLRRYAGVASLWALGVGAVFSGHYSGWNIGLLAGGWGGFALAAIVALALPFFLTREPQDALVQTLRCAPLAIAAVVGAVLGTSATVPGVPVQVSVFIPLMALIPAAIAMLGSVKT